MKNKGRIRAILTILLLVLHTIFFFIPVFLIGMLKCFPHKAWRIRCTQYIDVLAILWSECNNKAIKGQRLSHISCTGLETILPSDKYLVVANHQSWLDIVILHYVFTRKIPVLKFFIKDQLKWVPLLGFAWWAMGCPFMKRYSKEYLANNPQKRLKDVEATRKAMALFQQTPAAIMNFLEGTRFTPIKKNAQNSPYEYLLKPKMGGIGVVISTMSEQIKNILDVTIIYPTPKPSLWAFLCKRLPNIQVHIKQIPIPEAINTPLLAHDPTLQAQFKEWLHTQWAEKDNFIANIIKGKKPCLP